MSVLAKQEGFVHNSDWAFKRLFELESRLRSPTPSLQVEAIGGFPKLLDQFPFPTLVSSAFLKLGDLFRSCTNPLRYHIAQVFEASRQHLTQITQTEELLKRILTVLYSNDPIARALALRLVGNASIVFAEFPEAQHGVLLRYQSSHPLEIAAAVQTTESMLKYSPEFLHVVWETILNKADDARAPDSVRVRLIRSLQHARTNLQLSMLLYQRCRFWIKHPDTTVVVCSAAMDTWRSVLQPHNELALDDADFVSQFISHDLSSIRRAALALLGKWRPGREALSANTKCLENISDRLIVYLKSLLQSKTFVVDLGEFRQGAIVLARVEAACKPGAAFQSWKLASELFARAMRLFKEFLPKKLSRETDNYLPPLTTSSGDPPYRVLVASTMVAVNIATIISSDETNTAAASFIRDAWQAISEICEEAGHMRYIKQFLRISWAWSTSRGAESVITDALKDMMGSCNQQVAYIVVAIASSRRHYELFSEHCINNVKHFSHTVVSIDHNDHVTRAAWHSVLIVLAHCRRIPDLDTLDLATSAICNWSDHVCKHADQPELHRMVYAHTGPPPWLFLSAIELLAASGRWAAVDQLCNALPLDSLSVELQNQVYAISKLAKAEQSINDIAAFLRHVDASLSALRILERQGTRCTYRLFLIQLRRELVYIHSEWVLLQACSSDHPATAFRAKSLLGRMHDLMLQTDLVCYAFPSTDAATREWLAQLQRSLKSAICLCESGKLAVHNISATALLAIGKLSFTFKPGPSFFVEPSNPKICVETRPELGGGNSAFAVFSGSQFHFAAEGFVQLPRHPLSVCFQRVRIAVWLSRQPLGDSAQDLLQCSKYYVIAQQAKRYSINGLLSESSSDPGADESLDIVWDQAILFEAPIDSAYFSCPCAVTTPSLRTIFGHADANILAHIHMFCALLDTSGHVWWTGPHISHPLLVSTTAKS
ncbi:hypothetical protein COEREDRAFT_86354 [Coemansia reversa NRRL 1564]|uniref:Integrator complex subunit 7 N-terminal domain-containing protein n=1 Tax=Coemansia reversa (strain ATCC 12441 / NRRL 1564) TaxID=763665 RepID=A0A2G5BF73_COERN|nr:hypothetical protein COEREDRAFT_86354 [Coemansia reversa NRRL 1564]|eukprot:PIA17367.1 hypothetical protein COEREDRAFT_86354 [Coemansia reversa NRRL 1564]